jgi:phosphatidate cytidylyltransferase
MFRARVITAILLIAVIAVTLIYLPPYAFQWLVLLAVLFALAEFNRLSLSRIRFYRMTALCCGMGIALVQTWRPAWLPMDMALIGCLFLLALAYMWRATILEDYVTRVSMAFFGAAYIGLTLPYLGLIRLEPHGVTMVVATLAMVACSDTAAYTVGKSIGRRKLASQVSPNKTVEGFLGGFLGSLVAMLVCRALLWPEMPLVPACSLAVLIGFVAPMGDLIESAIKRACHVKDSGRMLPGHGGMLDRCDAYFFSGPAVYYFVQWFF